ncbi:hypothetical protein GWI33_014353 [Rhynchophorus ferrugineus]|uniref:Arf-GAP domain-containing protein n=1 Tax=Rhynchophorus ferrugineus TaxID=354439 RepID=A0A834I7H6_RHYFE|nr:hypothetical protein GWI33_014353 [Rhynchophorus ferrugineus]
MASRKKQDESNMKTLRELGALPQNKFCFDCGQRGPTYVNVTIGSFVCTKCSGILEAFPLPENSSRTENEYSAARSGSQPVTTRVLRRNSAIGIPESAKYRLTNSEN